MDRALSYHVLDVFTEQPYAGNPLAVVLGADGLTDRQMQAMAAEFNLAETVFVQTPEDPAHTARVRIFMTQRELPFAGHPTLGVAVFLAGEAHGTGDWDARVVLEERAGLVPVALSRRGGVSHGSFAAPVLPAAGPPPPPVVAIAAALGLAPAQIGFGAHAPGIWAGGPAFLFVPVADREALAAARREEPGWGAAIGPLGVVGAYLYTPGDGVDYAARMFAPDAGIAEDPATGSATALLAGPLRSAGALGPGTTRLRLAQGVEMGRPSQLTLEVDLDAGGGIVAVRVGGAAVRIAEGRITPP